MRVDIRKKSYLKQQLQLIIRNNHKQWHICIRFLILIKRSSKANVFWSSVRRIISQCGFSISRLFEAIISMAIPKIYERVTVHGIVVATRTAISLPALTWPASAVAIARWIDTGLPSTFLRFASAIFNARSITWPRNTRVPSLPRSISIHAREPATSSSSSSSFSRPLPRRQKVDRTRAERNSGNYRETRSSRERERAFSMERPTTRKAKWERQTSRQPAVQEVSIRDLNAKCSACRVL